MLLLPRAKAAALRGLLARRVRKQHAAAAAAAAAAAGRRRSGRAVSGPSLLPNPLVRRSALFTIAIIAVDIAATLVAIIAVAIAATLVAIIAVAIIAALASCSALFASFFGPR